MNTTNNIRLQGGWKSCMSPYEISSGQADNHKWLWLWLGSCWSEASAFILCAAGLLSYSFFSSTSCDLSNSQCALLLLVRDFNPCLALPGAPVIETTAKSQQLRRESEMAVPQTTHWERGAGHRKKGQLFRGRIWHLCKVQSEKTQLFLRLKWLILKLLWGSWKQVMMMMMIDLLVVALPSVRLHDVSYCAHTLYVPNPASRISQSI